MSTVRVMLVLALAATATSVSTAAQRPQPPAVTVVSSVPPPATALEAMLTQPGLLVSRDLYRVTDDGLAQSFGLAIDAVVARSLLSAPGPLLGLRVELTDTTPTTRVRVSYVDQAELAGLSQALGQMIALASQWTGREAARATEAQYATAGGFMIGFHQDFRTQFGFIGAGTVDPARSRCNVRDFPTIKSYVDNAITILKDK